MEQFIFLLAIFVLMWLMFIRPQQRRIRAQQQMLSSLQPGDEIVTAGGLIGTIRALDETQIRVEVASGIELRVVRNAISRRLGPTRGGEGPVGDGGAPGEIAP
jgi:preprotein translocase subunit YajC